MVEKHVPSSQISVNEGEPRQVRHSFCYIKTDPVNRFGPQKQRAIANRTKAGGGRQAPVFTVPFKYIIC